MQAPLPISGEEPLFEFALSSEASDEIAAVAPVIKAVGGSPAPPAQGALAPALLSTWQPLHVPPQQQQQQQQQQPLYRIIHQPASSGVGSQQPPHALAQFGGVPPHALRIAVDPSAAPPQQQAPHVTASLPPTPSGFGGGGGIAGMPSFILPTANSSGTERSPQQAILGMSGNATHPQHSAHQGPHAVAGGSATSTSSVRRQSDKSLFVSGLASACDWTDLHTRFSGYGKVISARVLRDAKTGHSRCIGYVNYASTADAQSALTGENGKPGPCNGGPLSVRFAEDDPAFTPEETKKLFVRYVPLSCSIDQLRALFQPFGEITDCTIMPDTSTAAKFDLEPFNMGYVTFANPEAATAACASLNKSTALSPRFPLFVKAAETLAARAQRQRRQEGGGSGTSSFHGSPANSATTLQQQQQPLQLQASVTGGAASGSGSGVNQFYRQLSPATMGAVSAPQPASPHLQHVLLPPPQQQQQQPQHQPLQPQVPPGYQLAYLPTADGRYVPVMVPSAATGPTTQIAGGPLHPQQQSQPIHLQPQQQQPQQQNASGFVFPRV